MLGWCTNTAVMSNNAMSASGGVRAKTSSRSLYATSCATKQEISSRTKRKTSFAVKDSRQRDGDEPVNSLVGVLAYLATDRLDVQYRVENLTREITSAACGTLARAQRVVRYFMCKPRLRNAERRRKVARINLSESMLHTIRLPTSVACA